MAVFPAPRIRLLALSLALAVTGLMLACWGLSAVV